MEEKKPTDHSIPYDDDYFMIHRPDCGLAHGHAEIGLHPTFYRTELCRRGRHCEKMPCYSAHGQQQLRPKANNTTRRAVYFHDNNRRAADLVNEGDESDDNKSDGQTHIHTPTEAYDRQNAISAQTFQRPVLGLHTNMIPSKGGMREAGKTYLEAAMSSAQNHPTSADFTVSNSGERGNTQKSYLQAAMRGQIYSFLKRKQKNETLQHQNWGRIRILGEYIPQALTKPSVEAGGRHVKALKELREDTNPETVNPIAGSSQG
ncbi:hypothetical protein TorRG33x02_120480 [Trema orientale]|uniref:Uncharacterized protein n=1 Tax=Trema orientale TaxID=63057 RepID=A0A2P5F3A3_TREOI|nr:hypothetical protein TorRG33x02_120480 [Trema orientale]